MMVNRAYFYLLLGGLGWYSELVDLSEIEFDWAAHENFRPKSLKFLNLQEIIMNNDETDYG